MAAPLVIKAPQLQPLAALNVVQRGGAAYYRELRNSSDRYLAAGAWCAILDANLMSLPLEAEVLHQCHHAGVRARAFRYFESVYEHESARTAASTAAASMLSVAGSMSTSLTSAPR